MAGDYDRRYRSVRGYEALLRSLPAADRPEAVESEADLDAEIRRSLAAKMSEPAGIWILDGQDKPRDKGRDGADEIANNESSESRHDQLSQHGSDAAADRPFTQIDRAAGTRIHEWSSIRHVEMVHRQGLHAPALILSYVQNSRPFYKASYVDSRTEDKPTPFMYIRQKRHRPKFRMSFDAEQMRKFRNPHYAGKCTVRVCDAERMICRVCSKASELIGVITITSKSGKHHVRVELAGQLLNWEEGGPEGLVMTGYVNNYLDPILKLRMEQSNRAVLEIRKSGPIIPAPNEAIEIQPDAMVYMDYPLTLFLSAAICVMVDSRRRGWGSRQK